MRSLFLIFCFLLVIGYVCVACESGESELDGGVVYTVEELCEENWDPANGSNGRLTQEISVTFTVPDGFPGNDASAGSSMGVRLSLAESTDIPVAEIPKAFGILDRSLELVPGQELTYSTDFIDRKCTSNAELCGESFYIMLGIYPGPSYQDSVAWVYISDTQYQMTGEDCIAIEDAELVRNLP